MTDHHDAWESEVARRDEKQLEEHFYKLHRTRLVPETSAMPYPHVSQDTRALFYLRATLRLTSLTSDEIYDITNNVKATRKARREIDKLHVRIKQLKLQRDLLRAEIGVLRAEIREKRHDKLSTDLE